MAQLCYSNSTKYRYRDEDDYYENAQIAESKKIEIVKRFVFNQLHSVMKIEDCLSNKRKFVTSNTEKDITQYGKGGLASLGDFKSLCNSGNIKEALLACHLTENEIDLLLHNSVEKSYQQSEAYLQKLQTINEKLVVRQNCLSEENKSNEQLELESLPTIPKDHPINFLPELENALFPYLFKDKEARDSRDRKQKNLSKKKRKKSDDAVCSTEAHSEQKINFSANEKYSLNNNKIATLWDVKENSLNPIKIQNLHSNSDRTRKCEKASDTFKSPNGEIVLNTVNVETVVPNFSRPFVWTMDVSQLTPISEIEQNKTDISVIKLDEKFKMYSCGAPSCTLYIRNLPRNLSPEKIVSIFGNFESETGPKIEYRILNGRMKGQAFVKFSSIQASTLALSTCNGFIIEGKPMVIEYGKS